MGESGIGDADKEKMIRRFGDFYLAIYPYLVAVLMGAACAELLVWLGRWLRGE